MPLAPDGEILFILFILSAFSSRRHCGPNQFPIREIL